MHESKLHRILVPLLALTIRSWETFSPLRFHRLLSQLLRAMVGLEVSMIQMIILGVHKKNERKHQLQKEKLAQEFHECCISFLTSMKLEALSHQLVSMGFPADRATMATIANEDELARIVEMEVQHKCSRQDVERAIVDCEGDLLKAEENLKLQKATHKSPILIRNPMKGITQQQRLDERDFNSSKRLAPGTSLQESVNKNIQQPFKRILPKFESNLCPSRTP
ncbi:hypothetical protein IEQ34_001794 [Dendrobium chrysotoxum]|uniref:UBA domain-containing protein n=1 Tax=Dendrobium chrysotoxum TaxID=161865 RepID=A0AAV7HM71_DENCH|nr:hypothetical protein IEQ34_001794 [Dendrobium chrysotoxum]